MGSRSLSQLSQNKPSSLFLSFFSFLFFWGGAYLSCVRLKVQEWCPLKLKFEKSLVKVHISKNDTVAQVYLHGFLNPAVLPGKSTGLPQNQP